MKRRPVQSFKHVSGMQVMLEESHSVPLVDLELTLRTGSTHDPEGLEGLTRLTWRVQRMGTPELRRDQVEEAISRLGARLSVQIAPSFVQLHGVVIRRNLDPFLELLSRLLFEPAFRQRDLAQAKRETKADLVALRDNDRSLAGRAFRQHLFGDHPYGRSAVGTLRSIGAIRRSQMKECYERHLVGGNAILGMSGAVSREDVEGLVERHFGRMPKGRVPALRMREARPRKGRHVLIVDKPARTQTQIFMGTLGLKVGDPLFYPLLIGNTAFGGTFTSQLMQEVREKRGWSYGAYSRLGGDRKRDAWFMWTFPSAEYAVDCIALQLELLEGLMENGISAAEHRFARDYLIKSHCFDLDTASKRLTPRIDEALYNLPPYYYDDFTPSLRKVRRAEVHEALKRRLSSRDLSIVLVATAKDVEQKLAELPGIETVQSVPYDRL
jgi:zinc protease